MGVPPPPPRTELLPSASPRVPVAKPSVPNIPRAMGSQTKQPSGIIPAPTKPVVTVYGARPLVASPAAIAAPVAPPPVSAPEPVEESFQLVDDPPTEVDGPPTMTIDNFSPEPLEHTKRRNAGRP